MSHIYPTTSSGLKSASTQIYSRNSLLHTIMLDPPSSGTASVTVYDTASGSATGNELAYLEVDSTTANSSTLVLTNAVEAKSGIYVSLTGTGSNFIVHYTPL